MPTRAPATVPTWRRPVGADPTRASLPYLYDAFLFSQDAHDIELDTRRHLEAAIPEIGYVYTSEHAAHLRMARYLAGHVQQLIVAGAPLPGPRNDDLHRVIRRANTTAAVTYVEHDPLVAAVLRAVAEHRADSIHVTQTDPLSPDEMWSDLREDRTVNHNRPIGMLLGGILSYHGGTRADVANVVQAHIAQLPTGSFLALTHLFDPETPEQTPLALAFEDRLRSSALGRGAVATRDNIETMIKGTELLPPGIVQADAWWPDGPTTPVGTASLVVAAISRISPPDDSPTEGPRRSPP
ncbi:SAM-dependent methyltransferase [Amycolatopsis nalaikhensis]|uniref:SAM-dependent methyltransferase n=1 Tax=Amycolatopsis nalaikhensis TaxID=715472 RepID=A0ABY8XC36_9PSEU|nr:SAM-dependent methyltransferase [Amycolatopsis sp. 2-2]WIV52894.1 SAM-dependent methyltransferase [Amycolatopsis sp. 2-2]